MFVPAGDMMPLASQKMVSMTFTAERDAFVFFGDASFGSFYSIDWYSFLGRTSRSKFRLPWQIDQRSWELIEKAPRTRWNMFPFCSHLQGQNQRNPPRKHMFRWSWRILPIVSRESLVWQTSLLVLTRLSSKQELCLLRYNPLLSQQVGLIAPRLGR